LPKNGSCGKYKNEEKRNAGKIFSHQKQIFVATKLNIYAARKGFQTIGFLSTQKYKKGYENKKKCT
jgi:hypothetical protein